MNLRDQKGRSRRPRQAVRSGDHFVFFHKVLLELPAGTFDPSQETAALAAERELLCINSHILLAK